ncbi:MAG: RluA family pseudouridine synthase [Candidatus Dojkabacteria bacterium]|jgi:23S rRNA pseudouridine1911/1915/1917 synthase
MEERVSSDAVGERLDIFVLNILKDTSFKLVTRSFLKKYWDNLVLVNEKVVKPSLKLKENDLVYIDVSLLEQKIKEDTSGLRIVPQEGDLDIFFENSEILILNKASGIVVHPGAGNSDNTLSNYVVGYLQSKGEYDERVKRGGVVHRLDKGVSGLILFAKTQESQMYYQKQFEEHKVVKLYHANVESKNFPTILKEKIKKGVDISSVIESLESRDFIVDDSWEKLEGYVQRNNVNRMKMRFTPEKFNNGGKYALTYVKPINENELLIKIETGRMHQIRATLEYLGINIVGDTLYSTKKGRGGVPDSIELTSILLSFENMKGERESFNLYKNAQKTKSKRKI